MIECSLVECPILYFHKIDRLIGAARSNKVSVTLGFQELPQLESDYGKVGMQKVITTVGNVGKPTGWICGQTARDFMKTKTGRGYSMDIQEAEEFRTSKFFCKTNFDMPEIAKEEKAYAQYPLPKFYDFPSVEARERILYANFLKINQEVKDMIAEIQEFCKR